MNMTSVFKRRGYIEDRKKATHTGCLSSLWNMKFVGYQYLRFKLLILKSITVVDVNFNIKTHTTHP